MNNIGFLYFYSIYYIVHIIVTEELYILLFYISTEQASVRLILYGQINTSPPQLYSRASTARAARAISLS